MDSCGKRGKVARYKQGHLVLLGHPGFIHTFMSLLKTGLVGLGNMGIKVCLGGSALLVPIDILIHMGILHRRGV